MPSFPRALGLAVSGGAVAASLVACGTVVVSHDPFGTAPAAPAAAPSSSGAPTPSPPPTPTGATPTPPTSVVPAGVAAFGDSVMLGAAVELRARGLRVDATESRQFHTGVSLVRAAAAGGTLPRNVVVHLGTNGTLAVADCRAVVDAAGPDRRVFFVTVHAPRSWTPADNVHLTQCDAAYPTRRVILVDWHRPAARHPRWFYADGIHLNGAGRVAYAAVVAATVDRFGI